MVDKQTVDLTNAIFDQVELGNEDGIVRIVKHCIDNSLDKPLELAVLNIADEHDRVNLQHLIASQCEFAKVKTGPIQGDATLFAIPVIFMHPGEKTLPVELKNKDRIESFFREKSYVRDEATLFIWPDLLTLWDIDLLPSDRYKLLAEFVSMSCFGKSKFNFFDDINSSKYKSQTFDGCALRFLLCLTISTNNYKPFLLVDKKGKEREKEIEAMEYWQNNMTKELEHETGIKNVMVLLAEPLFSSIQHGTWVFNEMNLLKDAVSARLTAEHVGSRCRAIVSLHGLEGTDELEYHITFMTDQEKAITVSIIKLIDIHQDKKHYPPKIKSILEGHGISPIEFINELLPLDMDVI